MTLALGQDTYIFVFTVKTYSSNSIAAFNQWILNFINSFFASMKMITSFFSLVYYCDEWCSRVLYSYWTTFPLHSGIIHALSWCTIFARTFGFVSEPSSLTPGCPDGSDHPQVSGSQLGVISAPGGHWQCLCYFWFSQLGTLSGRQGSMMLLNSLKCKGQSSPGRIPPGHNSGSAEPETP